MGFAIILGAIFLIFVLMRLFVRPRESLQEYQKKRQLHNDEILASLHEDTIPPEEAMRPVIAGIQESFELGRLSGCELENLGTSARLKNARGVLVVSWILRTAELRASHGAHNETLIRKGHWELRFNDHETQIYADTELAQLMAQIEHILMDEETLPFP